MAHFCTTRHVLFILLVRTHVVRVNIVTGRFGTGLAIAMLMDRIVAYIQIIIDIQFNITFY